MLYSVQYIFNKKGQYCIYVLGGSDYHIFEIFENEHIAADQLYVYEFTSARVATFSL